MFLPRFFVHPLILPFFFPSYFFSRSISCFFFSLPPNLPPFPFPHFFVHSLILFFLSPSYLSSYSIFPAYFLFTLLSPPNYLSLSFLCIYLIFSLFFFFPSIQYTHVHQLQTSLHLLSPLLVHCQSLFTSLYVFPQYLLI